MKVKPFSSLDDSSIGRSILPSSSSDGTEDSEYKGEQQGDINVQRASRVSSGLRTHFKEKFQSGRCKNLLLSLEKLDRQHDSITEESQSKQEANTRVVKNLNEFLNFSNLKRNNSLSPKKKKTNLVKEDQVYSEDDPLFNSSPDFSSLRKCSNDAQKNFDSVESNSTSTVSMSEDSSPDDSEYFPMTTSMTQELRIELDSLDRHVFGSHPRQSLLSDDTDDTESACSGSTHLETESDTSLSHRVGNTKIVSQPKQGIDDVFVWENPLKASPITPDEQIDLEQDGEWHQSASQNCTHDSSKELKKTEERNGDLLLIKNSPCKVSEKQANFSEQNDRSTDPAVMVTSNATCEEAIDLSSVRPLPAGAHSTRLPPPSEFGGGNPFLMFLCVTVLRQHRDFIMRNNMDYNEVAMHFDKMVRKHDVTRVLNQARLMYAAYLKLYNNNNNAGHVDAGKDSNVAGVGLKV